MNRNDYNSIIIEDACSILKDDGVIIVPTDTVYGLAALTELGAKKIYEIKKRDKNKKLPIIVDTYDRLKQLFVINDDTIARIKPFFPGKVTIILKSKKSDETFAVRMINNEIINKIIRELDKPLYLTSANISNEKECVDVEELLNTFDGSVDMVILGNKMSNVNSTIIDLTKDEICCVREGSVKFSEILEIYNR